MNATVHQPEFMLLFRNTQFEQRLSAEEMAEAMRRLNVWLERWSASGHIKSGQPLSDDGKIISGAKQRMVADGPFAESKEAIGGYVLVQAADFDEALKIADEWPLLDYDGIVELRPVRVQCPTMEEVGMELYPING
ncbi:MAG TPA: YciI family protein [Chthoniobacteraceae bacterium]|nr:YciI family protein [Chthoniobacteraceae bacterium]